MILLGTIAQKLGLTRSPHGLTAPIFIMDFSTLSAVITVHKYGSISTHKKCPDNEVEVM